MMKPYVLYVFTLPDCAPTEKLKAYVETLTKPQQATLEFVPLRGPDGGYTALAEKLQVDSAPTLVVTYEGLSFELDADGDEDCDYTEEPVERLIGVDAITKHLLSTIDGYTNANPPE
jgi:hypothetical protein